ncbi:nitronate monooxygenase [Actinomyces sp. zg296]|uniref:nitronate monooxygenase n=1 Tax=Actinomyces sp. zg296 TaxID=2609289 RepID=UPI001915F85F|nr:nitronate monooxygenase [Actinomyces sp. zg296]
MATTPLLASSLPLAAAPMAGGPSTVALAGAVAGAGAFPFLAGGYRSVEALAEQISQARQLGADFGVNLFVPSRAPVDDAALQAYARELAPEARAHGLELRVQPGDDDDGWQAKLDLLVSDPVPVVSFTFGLPEDDVVRRLRAAGTTVLVTVTTAREAVAAAEAGADGLVVQGPRAGGHSATFDPSRTIGGQATADVVQEVRGATTLPVIGTGGVGGGEDVRAILAAGAQMVAVGTLLLRADEAGTPETYRRALADPGFTRTIVTRAFSGRPARSLRNGFALRHPHAPSAYPAVNRLTLPLRAAAARAGDMQRISLWAGTGWRGAHRGSAADAVARLAAAL